MQRIQEFPGTLPRTGVGVSTGQPRIGYSRADQWGKYFCYLHRFQPLTSGAVRSQNNFGVDGSYDFLVQKRALLFDGANGGAVLLQTQISPQGETFEYSPIYGSASWGSGQFPEVVGKAQAPIAWARNSIVTLFGTDGQAVPAEQNVFLAHHGTKVARQIIVPARTYGVAKPFQYAATFNATTFDSGGAATGPIPAASTKIFNVSVDNDGDFDVMGISVVSDSLISVMVNSDSDNWFISPLRSELLGGSLIEAMPTQGQFSGQHIFWLPGPRLITAAGYITVTVSNLDAVNAQRVQVVFHGLRCYPAGGA